MDFDDLLSRHRAAVPRAPRRAGPLPAPLPPRARRRVPGHQPGPERARRCCSAGRAPQRVRGGRLATSRSTASGRADIRNILEFEQAFPDATVVVLDQNYRSTQTILDAANAVIANNLSRKPKDLWTDAGRGDQIVRYHAEDETDEAQWVGREMARLHDGGDDPLGRDGRLLPDQRPVPRDRGPAHAGRHPLQGRGWHPLLRPPRGEGRPRLREGGGQPVDEVSVKRILNVPKRGIGDTTVGRIDAWARAHGLTFMEALRRADDVGLSGRAVTGHRRLRGAARRAGRRGRRRSRRRCSRPSSTAPATWPSSRPSTPSRPRAASRTWPSWSGVAQDFDDGRRLPRAGRPWWPTPTTWATTTPRSRS